MSDNVDDGTAAKPVSTETQSLEDQESFPDRKFAKIEAKFLVNR